MRFVYLALYVWRIISSKSRKCENYFVVEYSYIRPEIEIHKVLSKKYWLQSYKKKVEHNSTNMFWSGSEV